MINQSEEVIDRVDLLEEQELVERLELISLAMAESAIWNESTEFWSTDGSPEKKKEMTNSHWMKHSFS